MARLKRLTLTGELLLELLSQDGTRALAFSGLPEDAVLMGVRHTLDSNSLDLLIASDTFPDLPEGEPFPELEIQVTTQAVPAPVPAEPLPSETRSLPPGHSLSVALPVDCHRVHLNNNGPLAVGLTATCDGSQAVLSLSPGDVGERYTLVRKGPAVGRNDPCACGSGKKRKKCCGDSAAKPKEKVSKT